MALGQIDFTVDGCLCLYEGDYCDMDEIQVSVAFNMLPESCH
jgi:hypothetical protein